MTVCAPLSSHGVIATMTKNRKPSMGSYHTTPGPKKTDYRKRPWGGAFGRYLLEGFKRREQYHPDGLAFDLEQPYEDERTRSGHFVHIEGGVPRMKRQAVNQLDGYDWRCVALAIEMVRKKDPLAIAALEWHQLPTSVQPTRYAWADANHCCEQRLSDRYKSAVRQVRETLWFAREVHEGRRLWDPDA